MGQSPRFPKCSRLVFPLLKKPTPFCAGPIESAAFRWGSRRIPSVQRGKFSPNKGNCAGKAPPHGWDLLYLGIQAPPDSFIPLPGEWRWEDHAADLYGSQNRETRFPKPLSHPQDLKVGQRYFRDERTARVHFIALIPR